jgi:hypothetical protein
VVNHALPNFKQAAGLFGSDITRDDMKTLLSPLPAPGEPAPIGGGTAGAFGNDGINQITNGDGDGNQNLPPTP